MSLYPSNTHCSSYTELVTSSQHPLAIHKAVTVHIIPRMCATPTFMESLLHPSKFNFQTVYHIFLQTFFTSHSTNIVNNNTALALFLPLPCSAVLLLPLVVRHSLLFVDTYLSLFMEIIHPCRQTGFFSVLFPMYHQTSLVHNCPSKTFDSLSK